MQSIIKQKSYAIVNITANVSQILWYDTNSDLNNPPNCLTLPYFKETNTVSWAKHWAAIIGTNLTCQEWKKVWTITSELRLHRSQRSLLERLGTLKWVAFIWFLCLPNAAVLDIFEQVLRSSQISNKTVRQWH